MAISFTQQDLDALKAALLTGANEVQIGDRRVRYNSQSEIINLINMISSFLDASTTTSSKVSQASYKKGVSE
jgi:hypothetical protein